MLANLLSRKSIFIEIILGILFLGLFIWENIPFPRQISSVSGLISFGLMALVGFLFFKTSKLIKTSGFAIFYYLIWCFVFSDISFEPRIAISFLISTILFWRMVHAEEIANSKKFPFDVGFLLGISAFVYPPSLFLLGIIFFNYLYLQSLNLRIFVLFVLGFIFPILIGIETLFLMDKMYLIEDFQKQFCIDFWNNLEVIALLPILALIIGAWIDHVAHSSTQDINKRHIYFLFFLYFINWIVITIIFAGENVNYIAILGFPIAVFLGRYTQYLTSKTWQEVVLWIYTAFLIGFYFRVEISKFYQELLGNVRF